MLSTFCINRDHKISFSIITLPLVRALGLKFSLHLALFIFCALVYGYIDEWLMEE
jgi:hypothetical protein